MTQITTSGTVNVTSENTLHMSAGNSITLLPGFSAQAGSEFSAKIENIVDCGTKGSTSKVLIQSMPDEDEEINEITGIEKNQVLDFSYKVYPNPSNELINIQYFLDTEITQIPISEFANGTYFLTISTANQTKIEKIIINNM